MAARTRKTTSAMSAFLVICPPHDADTAESLIACLDTCPSAPLGWNASNSALRSFSVSSLVSVSERICTVAEPPLPTMTTDSGDLPSALLNTSSTCWVLTVPFWPATGIDTLVPPSKSIPKVKPRNRMLARATATIKPLTAYQSLRRPMTSKAPVPVYRRTKKPCLGALAAAASRSGASTASESVTSDECLAAIWLSPFRRVCGRSSFARNLLHRAQPVERRLGQRRRLRGEVHQRPGHQEHHDDVQDRRQAQRERKALHLADRQDVEHRGGQEGHRIAGQNRLARPGPAAWHS